MLKFQLDTLEGVDEAVRALYTEKDGKFVLGIEGLPQQEDVSGLKAKVDELLGEKKAAEKKAREAEDAARLEREEAARKSGNVEELERSWTEKFTRREAELNGTLELAGAGAVNTERSNTSAILLDRRVSLRYGAWGLSVRVLRHRAGHLARCPYKTCHRVMKNRKR